MCGSWNLWGTAPEQCWKPIIYMVRFDLNGIKTLRQKLLGVVLTLLILRFSREVCTQTKCGNLYPCQAEGEI